MTTNTRNDKQSKQAIPKGHRILVVDDEWPMRELLKNVLTLSGFEVLLAKDEKEFREQVIRQKPDAVILDIMLGDLDGTVIYDLMLKEGLLEGIPIIFLSALAQDRPPTLPQKNRRFALIGKPFDPEELVQALHAAL